MSDNNEGEQPSGEAAGGDPLSWVHAGSCPVCGDGLRRARYCTDSTGETHFYLLCDECEAIWLAPDDSGEQKYASMEDPMCPICSASMYGSSAGWLEANDLNAAPWSAGLTVTSASDALSEGSGDCFSADFSDQDATVTGPIIGDEPTADDASYGQDEPRPGC